MINIEKFIYKIVSKTIMVSPFLYGLVDSLYKGVMQYMPKAVQERGEVSAAILGATGIYGVVRGLQWASKNIVDNMLPGFDSKALPVLEKVCIAGMATIPFLYAAVDPDGAKEIMTQHPTYTSGMFGVWFGSIFGAGQDLVKRRIKKVTEETKGLERYLE